MTQSHSVIEANRQTPTPVRSGKWSRLFEDLRSKVLTINAPASDRQASEEDAPWLFEFNATSAQDHFRRFPAKIKEKGSATPAQPSRAPRWSQLPVGSFRVGPNHLGVSEIIVTREGEAHLIGEVTRLCFGSLYPALDVGCFAAQNGCGIHRGGDVDIASNSRGHVLELHPEDKLDKAFSLSMCINGVWSSTPVLV